MDEVAKKRDKKITEIKTDNLTHLHSPRIKIMPRTQLAQKCPYCGKYLLSGEPTTVYNGTSEEYTNWIVHEEC